MTAIAEPLHIELQTQNPNDRVALRGVRLRGRIAGMSLKATVEQTFVNLAERAIEAVYTFPLAEGAAVCGFEVVFFDKVFTGVVEETDRAIEKYDDAIAQGHGAYLLEQHRPDVFSVRVGNLKPRQAVTIRLTYVTDLQAVDRQIRLSFPTTIAPRYVTASGMDPIDAAIEGDALNPPHVLSVPYGFSMEMEIELGKLLAGVTSPSHAITPALGTLGAGGGEGRAGKPITITLATTQAEMNRDLVLVLSLTKEQSPFALASRSSDGENFIAVNFLPEFEESELAKIQDETIFVLDCSGSMQGESMGQATAALECCLRAMSAGDTFNICRFGSTFELLAPEPVGYSQETLNRALGFIRQGANLGGTELLAPLQAIFEQIGAVGVVRNIVLLTDGQVSNEPAIIALAKRKRSRNRIFTFGIGSASSSFLVNGLARVTGGAAEFIAAGERIEEKVLRTFGRLVSPPVSEVEIDWNDADAQVAPRQLPPLFDGDALRVFARLPGKIPQTVTLKCRTASGPKSWSVPVMQGADPAGVLPTLWARAMIRVIEEEDGVQQSALRKGRSAKEAKLIELSKRYNVVCSLTSFVAVEHRSLEDRNEGKPALRRVPVMLAAGWGGTLLAGGVGSGSGLLDLTRESDDTDYGAELLDEIIPESARYLRSFAPMPAPASPPARSSGFFGKLKKAIGGGSKMEQKRAFYGGSDKAGRSKDPDSDGLINLLSQQGADGSFERLPTIKVYLSNAGRDPVEILKAIDRLLDSLFTASTDTHKLRTTLLALAAMKLAFANRRELWKRAYKKGMDWVAGQGVEVAAAERVIVAL
jgi:Ca-activated chloride channel family protein